MRKPAGTRKIASAPSNKIFDDLSHFPRHPEYLYHFQVDFVELLCVTHPDGRMSKQDVLDEQSHTMESEESPDYAKEQDGAPDSVAEPLEHGRQAQRLLRDEAKVDSWYGHLAYRKDAFGEFYPFTLSSDGETLILIKDLTLKQKLYVFLLLCSSLGYIAKKGGYRDHKFPLAFERLSGMALREYLPQNAQIHIFGTSTSGGVFQGSLWDKIVQLSAHLNGKVIAEQSDITGSADGGADLVAWVPLGDSNTGMMIIFCQCACTPKWVEKQEQASYESRWKHRIYLKHPSSVVTFMPYCFRKEDGTWLNVDHVRSILIDRERFIRLFSSRIGTFRSHDGYKLTEEALLYKRTVY